MPRPYWKGYLKLALVSCPIALYSATSSSERIAFRQINKKTGNRLRQQLVDEMTRETVEAQDKGRGFEVDKNVYIPIPDEELDAIAIESNHTIDIDSFVPRPQIDERYLDTPYYLAPNDKVGAEAFAVIREAMRGKDMVALGRVVLAKRERVIMLQPWDKGLLGETLRYPYEVKDAAEFFADIPDIPVQKDMLDLAEHLIRQRTATFDPAQFHDRFEEAMAELLAKKQAGAPGADARAAPPPRNVIDIMDALRRSLGQEPAQAAAQKPTPGKTRKKTEGQREMLLPIAGAGKAKDAKAVPAASRGRKAG